MPRRNDLESILIIGSGPIVIGQACEFDYSGTQACRVLKEEGFRVILANSNPATIMTDPDFADATYIEPLTWEVVSAIIDKEQPDAVLPTLGGQTGLNIAMELFERGPDRRAGQAGDDRRQRRGDRHRRGPRELQGRDDRDRSRIVPLADRALDGRGADRDGRNRSADHDPAGLHPRRTRHRASRPPSRSSSGWRRPGSTPARSARSSSRSRSSAGRSTSSR